MKTLLTILLILILFVAVILLAGLALCVASAYGKSIERYYEETHEEL